MCYKVSRYLFITEASILFFFFFLSEALYYIYTVKYSLKIYFQMA